MVKVIGVRFRTAGKVYFFDPLDFEIKRGDNVIVETARGIEFGKVMGGVTEVEDDKVIQPLKPVIRIANQRDIEQEAANKEKEKEAFKICLEKIRKHELEMKLIDAEYTFDNNKVLFYFTADGRIDFRELVKDLAGVFKTRIELRQIGVRDETKIVGGIGICGRPLCCHSYLSDFIPVSIKMAKEQNLSLNPTKISGVCGRLMCCLKNEEETYEELNRRLPGIGDYVTTEDGLKGEVQSVNVLRQLVKVIVEAGDEKEIKEYPVDKLQFKRRHGKKDRVELSSEELQELERLEDEEQSESQQSEGQQERKPAQRYNDGQGNRGRQENRNRPEGGRGYRQDRNRGENRPESRGEGRFENRGENRPESRGEGRFENRGENRPESRGESRFENRGENRPESRGESRFENRGENRSESRGEGRFENRGENRPESRGESRFENRGENRLESRGEGRFENRGENRPENGGKRYYERRGEDEQREQRNGGRNNRHNRHRNNNRPRQEGKFGQNDNQSEG